MSRRFLAGVTALAGAASLLSCALLGPGVRTCPAADGKEAPGTDVSGASRVWSAPPERPARESEAGPPPAGGFGFPGAPPAPAAPPAPGDKRDSERNLFGTEFRWAEGDFSAD